MKIPFLYTTITALILLLSCLNADNILAQEKSNHKQMVLKDLKEGTLIVRLKSHDKKLNKIEEFLNSETISEKAKKRYRKIKNTTIAYRDSFNRDLVQTMTKSYSFSNLAFIYDKDYRLFKDGKYEGIFLDTELMPLDRLPKLEGKFFYWAESQTNMSGNSIAGMVLYTTENTQAPNWLPNYIKAKSNTKSLTKSINKNKYPYKPATKIVNKLEKRLQNLWLKYR